MAINADADLNNLIKQQEMEDFFQEVRDNHMEAIWDERDRVELSPRAPGEPHVPYPPHLWRWDVIRPFMDRAGELIEPGPIAERRVLKLVNPALSGPGSTPTSRWASHTVSGNVQMILPGETAPCHRHRNNAIRFILEGTCAFSIVDGEAIEMRPGDLVLTPSWQWHGHVSKSDVPVLWMDSLDGPFVFAMRQNYMMEKDPVGPTVTKPDEESLRRFGTQFLRPVQTQATPASPLLSFPWTETERALHAMADLEADPFDDVAFFYTNPSTGGHVLPTIGCRIQMIRPQVHTKAHRHSTTGVFHVFRGSGSTIVDGIKMDWHQGDFFTLPPHCWHEHVNSTSEEAVLFSTTDAPIIEALNMYREEPYAENDGHQSVTGDYQPT